MSDMMRRPLPKIVSQHAEESAFLLQIRLRLVSAPHVRLRDLKRHDARLAAHLDGLTLAGELGSQLPVQALESPGTGEVFVATVRAIEDANVQRFGALCALAAVMPGLVRGVSAALGWVSPQHLQGTIRDMLASAEPIRRQIGVAACALHRVDPGLLQARRLEDGDTAVRARGLRASGELGKPDLMSACLAAIADEDPECQLWAAWSTVLLGNRNRALDALAQAAVTAGPRAKTALQLTLQAMNLAAAHQLLQRLAESGDQSRRLIQGCGFAGDPMYAPWLINQMADMRTARLAGEAFSLVTGADLKLLQLVRERPESFEPGPNDDPNDPDVEMDEDDGLPWPDPATIQAWWHANSQRFQPGMRYFMGEPLNRDNCLRVLKEGYQRQRIAAALYLCLLNPGTPLFEWRAPAWRQQRLLAQMT